MYGCIALTITQNYIDVFDDDLELNCQFHEIGNHWKLKWYRLLNAGLEFYSFWNKVGQPVSEDNRFIYCNHNQSIISIEHNWSESKRAVTCRVYLVISTCCAPLLWPHFVKVLLEENPRLLYFPQQNCWNMLHMIFFQVRLFYKHYKRQEPNAYIGLKDVSLVFNSVFWNSFVDKSPMAFFHPVDLENLQETK